MGTTGGKARRARRGAGHNEGATVGGRRAQGILSQEGSGLREGRSDEGAEGSGWGPSPEGTRTTLFDLCRPTLEGKSRSGEMRLNINNISAHILLLRKRRSAHELLFCGRMLKS